MAIQTTSTAAASQTQLRRSGTTKSHGSTRNAAAAHEIKRRARCLFYAVGAAGNASFRNAISVRWSCVIWRPVFVKTAGCWTRPSMGMAARALSGRTALPVMIPQAMPRVTRFQMVERCGV